MKNYFVKYGYTACYTVKTKSIMLLFSMIFIELHALGGIFKSYWCAGLCASFAIKLLINNFLPIYCLLTFQSEMFAAHTFDAI